MTLAEEPCFVPAATATRTGAALRAETARGAAAVEAVLADWVALQMDSADPPAACRLSLRDLDDSVRLILVWDRDHLVGLWALRRRRVGPLRVAHRLGGDLQTYDGLVVSSSADADAVASAAWGELARWSDVDAVQLAALRAHDPLVPHARQAGARVVSIARTLDLRPWADADAFFSGLARRRRGSLRRRARKLATRGDVVFTAETDPVARVRAVQQAIRLKLGWLDAQAAAAPVFRGRAFQDALRACAADPRLVDELAVFTLRVGGALAAVEICTVAGRACRSFIGAYDPDFSKEGVGAALTLRTIGWAIGCGLDTYDLLPPDTAFKQEWADGDTAVLAATLPLGPAGRTMLPFLRDGRAWLKARFEALPEGTRARVKDALGLLLG